MKFDEIQTKRSSPERIKKTRNLFSVRSEIFARGPNEKRRSFERRSP